MTATAVILIMIAHGPVGRAVTRAVAASLVSPFVEAPKLIVKEAKTDPSSRHLVGVLAENHEAEAAVFIACATTACSQLKVRVVRKDGRSVTQSLRFRSSDSPAERGRAAGLLASSLLPEEWSRRDDKVPDRLEDKMPEAPVIPEMTSVRSWSAQVAAAYYLPMAGIYADFGLQVGLMRRIGSGFEVGFMGRVEQGTMEGGFYDGSFYGYGGGPGIVWRNAGWDTPGKIGYGARLEGRIVHRDIRHPESDGVEGHDYWGLGAQLSLIGGYALSPSISLTMGLGIEYLRVDWANEEDDPVARLLDKRRFTSEVGICTRF